MDKKNYSKYIKYKTKYLMLKNKLEQCGGLSFLKDLGSAAIAGAVNTFVIPLLDEDEKDCIDVTCYKKKLLEYTSANPVIYENISNHLAKYFESRFRKYLSNLNI